MVKRFIGFFRDEMFIIDSKDLKERNLSMDDVLSKIQAGMPEGVIVGEII